MYILLTLFFTSLFGITFMIFRKLILIQGNGEIIQNKEKVFDINYLEEWKNTVIKKIRKYVYFMLVVIVRLYVWFSTFVKNKYQEFKTKLQKRMIRNEISEEKREISKFLQIISEYKNKIRAIKYRIKEEEKDL